ncbi:MAG: hypothetical protein GY847_02880 [Proteobacteria bacterium]|nr:hypothetical protein [Pseudomonadota bacterium]
MKYLLRGALACCLALVTGCDKPDEVYNELPPDYDPDIGNGISVANIPFDGEKGWEDESTSPDGGTDDYSTVEVCSDREVSEKVKWMIKQPIIPMVGAGGLDMRGKDEDGNLDWSGLTIDEAQKPENLCQATIYSESLIYWGDLYELIAIYNTETREIIDMVALPGYEGTVEAGDYVFELNEPVTKAGNALDGNSVETDPKSDDNLRKMDRALIRTFRPSLPADQVDCVDSGSCYVMVFGTQPVLVFMSVGFYVVLEPSKNRISQLEMSLRRPFKLAMGEVHMENDLYPIIEGTAGAGISDCKIEYGKPWSEIEANCLGGDPKDMALIQAAWGYELISSAMGGVSLFFERPDLPKDEILPTEPELRGNDRVSLVSINAEYEGNVALSYSDILRGFKEILEEDIRDELDLENWEKTGVELLREPDDVNLPDSVKDEYKEQLRPGGVFAAFCEDFGDPGQDAGVDAGPHIPEYECYLDSGNRPFLPLMDTLKNYVAFALGPKAKPKHEDTTYYVQNFHRAIGQYFNGGTRIDDNQIILTPRAGRPDMIDATISIKKDDKRHTIGVLYGGNDDRIHYMSFQMGGTRQEEVLYKDAEGNPKSIFTYKHLRGSEVLGLGKVDTVRVKTHLPDIRRAVLELMFKDKNGEMDPVEVLAQYQKASPVTGYWIPIQGVHDTFVPADWFSLGGGTIGAGFYMLPESYGSEENEIVAITSSAFFGKMPWCEQNIELGDPVDELIQKIAEDGYPCEMIIKRSENNEYITSMTDVDANKMLAVENNQIQQVISWIR